jgi:hypothetical protein
VQSVVHTAAVPHAVAAVYIYELAVVQGERTVRLLLAWGALICAQ